MRTAISQAEIGLEALRSLPCTAEESAKDPFTCQLHKTHVGAVRQWVGV